MARFTKQVLFLLLFSFFSCAVQEVAFEQDVQTGQKESYHSTPVLLEARDTVMLNNIQSAIQRSPLYHLRGLTENRDGKFFIALSEEDLEKLQIPLAVYDAYQSSLQDLNKYEN